MISVGAELCGSLIFRMRSLHRPVVDYSVLKVKFAFFHQVVFLVVVVGGGGGAGAGGAGVFSSFL